MANPTKPPKGAVKALKVKRGTGRTLTASWKVGSELTKDSPEQATRLDVTWTLGIRGKGAKTLQTKEKTSVRAKTVNLSNLNCGKSTYTRDSFYPVTDVLLPKVTCTVRAANKKGGSAKSAARAYAFKVPRRPVIGAFELDEATGVVSVTVTTDPGNDALERYDTEYYWTVYDSSTGANVVDTHTSTTATSLPLSHNAASYQSQPYGTYLRFTVRARSRGYAGPSAWVEGTYYLGYPLQPVIDGVDVAGTNDADRVTVKVITNEEPEHPITAVQLEALPDVAYATLPQVEAASDTWTEVGAPDDGKCTALACTVHDLATTEGRHCWVRVRSWYAVEGVLVSRSVPAEVTDLHVDAVTVTSDAVLIASAEPGADGTSAVVTLAWAPTGATDTSDGTELSWSDQPDTWRSTEDPETYLVTYDDGPLTVGTVTYQSSATIIVKGLELGAVTYVRARRYTEGESGTAYGPYGNVATIIPSVAPSSVVLHAPAYVAEGADVDLEWTYEGGSAQTAWQLLDAGGTVLAEGDDALGAYTLDASRAASMAVGGSLALRVAVSTGGSYVTSAAVTVRIVQAPTLAITVPATITAQAAPNYVAFAATCSADAALEVVVTARGLAGEMPYGMLMQPEGDTVWSGTVLPEWSNGTAAVTLPDSLALHDNGDYLFAVVATDPATGLRSAEATGEATVAWAHQAPDPDGCVTLRPIGTVDADGNHRQAVELTLAAPDGSAATDSYDVYRLTNDGPQLVAEGYPLALTVTDEFAPFSDGTELAYRVACRTADGDAAWTDVPYRLRGDAVRIDWDGNTLELPFDLALSGGYAKGVDVHEFLDGTRRAYHGAGVTRTARVSSDVLRLEDPATIAAVHALARHEGTAFVRTPDGCAFEADVQVSELAPTHELAAVSIDATEVVLAAAHMLPEYNVTDETEAP